MSADEQLRPWSDLPTDLLTLIVYHLSFKDHVMFSAVCKKFRDIASETLHSQALRLPWLIPRHGYAEEEDKTRVLELYSPLERRTYCLTVPNSFNFVNSCMGWSVVSVPRLHLLNPFTHQRIDLPSSNHPSKPSYTLGLSSFPRDSVSVAVGVRGSLLFCKLGDPEWTCLIDENRDGGGVVDHIFFGGLLYCSHGFFDKFSVYDLEPRLALKCRLPHPGTGHRSHLVESAGELLMVVHYFREDFFSGGILTVDFDAYKLDQGVPQWKKVSSLGDMTLLWGYNSLISVDAAKLSRIGCRRNCIYFKDEPSVDYGFEDMQIRVFNFDGCPTDGSEWFMLNA